MFVKVTSGHLFARLTSAPPALQPDFNYSIGDIKNCYDIIQFDIFEKETEDTLWISHIKNYLSC